MPRYRIVDVRERSIQAFTRPDRTHYLERQSLRAGDRLNLGEAGSPLGGLEIDAGEVFGQALL